MAKQNQLLFLFATLLVIVVSVSKTLCRPLEEEHLLNQHKQWMAIHNRDYKDVAEKAIRYEIFKENVKRINAFNKGKDVGYKLAVNKFADLTNEEFRAYYTGYKRRPTSVLSSAVAKPFKYANFTAIPAALDWRTKKAVTSVKDQGPCGSCWAFSAVAAIEGITMLKKGSLVPLSVQELVDCDDNDEGCGGGLMDNAFRFIISKGGLTTEANYPYQGNDDGTCNTAKTANNAASITGYQDVPANNEKALLQAVANQPVSVAIEADGFDVQFYSSGVFTGSCGTGLNHAVVAVGYGNSGGTKYWLLKNSWGTGWGESGYMRIQRDVSSKAGLCGLAMLASYPTA